MTDEQQKCEECGKVKEHQDSNLCIECVAKMLEDTEAFS